MYDKSAPLPLPDKDIPLSDIDPPAASPVTSAQSAATKTPVSTDPPNPEPLPPFLDLKADLAGLAEAQSAYKLAKSKARNKAINDLAQAAGCIMWMVFPVLADSTGTNGFGGGVCLHWTE